MVQEYIMKKGLFNLINSLIGKAIFKYNLIQDGDRILVAVSGGKDSMTLLWFLKERLKWIPVNYELFAVHIDPGFEKEDGNIEKIESFFREIGVDYKLIKTDIGADSIELSKKTGQSTCFFCSRKRRRLIFEVADEMGFNKIAYGHHRDDVIETFLINLFYGASISTMLPVQEFFDGRFKIIRPFYLVDESLIKRFFKSMNWPEIKDSCPFSSNSKRKEVREIIKRLYTSNKKVKANIFHALHNVRSDYLPQEA